MPQTLDLQLTNTFLAVVQVEGFKSAVQRLSKTPAAVSLQIKRLEDIVGFRILERSNQGIRLTSAGEILKDKGKKLMVLNHELLGDLQEHELSGHLCFGAPTDYARTLRQSLLPIFQQELPRMSLSLFLKPSRALRSKVNAGGLDMATVAREADSLGRGGALGGTGYLVRCPNPGCQSPPHRRAQHRLRIARQSD